MRSHRPTVEWIACCLGRGRSSPLTQADVEALADELGTDRYAGGTYVFREGASPASVHIIFEGTVELSRDTGENRVVFESLGPGDVFGDVPLLMEMMEPFDAKTAEDSVVLSIDSSTLFELLAHRPGLTRRWLMSMAERMAGLQERLADLLSGGLEAQIASLLLHRGPNGTVKLSQATIAELLGTRRSSVNRVLKSLEATGLVKLGYRSVTIHDAERLRVLAERG